MGKHTELEHTPEPLHGILPFIVGYPGGLPAVCCNFLGTLQGDFFNETWSGAGSMITDSSLASGAQTTELHEANGEFWRGEFWKGTAFPKKDLF